MTKTNQPLNVISPNRLLRLAVLAGGPVASWYLFQSRVSEGLGNAAPLAALVVVALWSPLYFSVPAILCQRERDRLLPAGGGPVASLVRGTRLIPAMLDDESGIRLETIVTLIAFAVILTLSAGDIVAAAGMLI